MFDDQGKNVKVRPAQIEAPIVCVAIRGFEVGTLCGSLVSKLTSGSIDKFQTYDLWVCIPSAAAHVGYDMSHRSGMIDDVKSTRTNQWEIGVVVVHQLDERCIFCDRVDTAEDGLRFPPELCERAHWQCGGSSRRPRVQRPRWK